MRVLHVIPSVAFAHGGPSVVLRTTANALAAQGLQVDIATTDDDGAGQRRPVPLGDPVDEDGVTYRYFARQTGPYKASLPLARWLFGHAGDYDVLHIHSLFSFAPAAAAAAARRAQVPYVVRPLGVLNQWGRRERRPWLKQLSYASVERRILDRAAAVQWTTVAEQHEASDLRIRAPGVVIPNPVDLPPARPRRRQTPATILSMSRLDEKKGIDILLSAFALLAGRGTEADLIIAGSGPARLLDQLRGQADSLGVASRVRWAGHVTGDQREALFERAWVFVLPSRSENFGVAAVEALARRCPVVISDQVGNHREIVDAGAGLAVDLQPSHVAEAIGTYLDDHEAARTAGERGSAFVASRYAPGAVASQLVDLYDDLIHGRRPRPSYAAAPTT